MMTATDDEAIIARAIRKWRTVRGWMQEKPEDIRAIIECHAAQRGMTPAAYAASMIDIIKNVWPLPKTKQARLRQQERFRAAE
jgi:hypothetical protein